MKLLFTLDEHNYSDDMPVLERFAVRGIVCRNGKYLMQKSREGDFKIPGGGIDKGETNEQALAREVLEETGYRVISESIKVIGETLEQRVDCFNDKQKYVAHSYFYFCDVEDEAEEPQMTPSEIKLGYHPDWEDLDEIIRVNAKFIDDFWQERDYKFLCMLQDQQL